MLAGRGQRAVRADSRNRRQGKGLIGNDNAEREGEGQVGGREVCTQCLPLLSLLGLRLLLHTQLVILGLLRRVRRALLSTAGMYTSNLAGSDRERQGAKESSHPLCRLGCLIRLNLLVPLLPLLLLLADVLFPLAL